MTGRESTVETNEDIVRRIPTEILDGGDADLVNELFAENFVGHVPPVRERYTVRGIRGSAERF